MSAVCSLETHSQALVPLARSLQIRPLCPCLDRAKRRERQPCSPSHRLFPDISVYSHAKPFARSVGIFWGKFAILHSDQKMFRLTLPRQVPEAHRARTFILVHPAPSASTRRPFPRDFPLLRHLHLFHIAVVATLAAAAALGTTTFVILIHPVAIPSPTTQTASNSSSRPCANTQPSIRGGQASRNSSNSGVIALWNSG